MAVTAPRGLEHLTEARWPLGVWRSGATELEPEGSAFEITGLIGDDGLPYRRGGSVYKSNAALGTTGLTGVWDGKLFMGQRTLFLASGKAAALSADDTTPVEPVSASALTNVGSRPTRIVSVGAQSYPYVVVPVTGATAVPMVWSGSRKTAAYSTGTASMTVGNAVVTGAGTSWSANVDAGMLLQFSGDPRFYVVQSVDSNTQLTLGATPTGSGAGAYSLSAIRPMGNANLAAAITAGRPMTALAVVANRLLVAARDRLYFSTANDAQDFSATNYHELPSEIVALGALRDSALVFTMGGVHQIQNLALNLTDAQGNPQQKRELVNADLIAWSHEGIAPWSGQLVVPALDNIWLMDGVSAPVPIGDSVKDLYLSYVRAGYAAGVAEVFNSVYLLPILTTANVWVDTLVCRLHGARGSNAPAWSSLAGQGAEVAAFAERSVNPPVLLGASRKTTSRVLDLTAAFSPVAGVKNDADATTHTFRLTTRNLAVGERPTTVLYCRAKYSLVDAASDNPTMTAEASVDGGSYTTLTVSTGTGGTTVAGEQDGSEWVYWTVSLAAQYLRLRFTCSSPAASLQFKRLEVFYRPRGDS